MSRPRKIFLALVAYIAIGFAGWCWGRIDLSEMIANDPTAVISVEEGQSYSLLINDERFLLRTRPGQKVQVRILAEGSPDLISQFPPHVQAPFDTDQGAAVRVRRSRFRFRYDAPIALRDFRKEEHLERLRGSSDLETARNVMRWARSQFEPRSLERYPPQNARDLLRAIRDGEGRGFCAQYCYLTVQALQALGFAARHITIDGHEVCEAWFTDQKRWGVLDPLYEGYFTNSAGDLQNALEVHSSPREAFFQSGRPVSDTAAMIQRYRNLSYWLHNDLYTRPIHLFDLSLYMVHVAGPNGPSPGVAPYSLMTAQPEELYEPPLPLFTFSLQKPVER